LLTILETRSPGIESGLAARRRPQSRGLRGRPFRTVCSRPSGLETMRNPVHVPHCRLSLNPICLATAALCLLLGLSHPAAAQKSTRAAEGKDLIAVLEMEAVGASAVEASALTDRFREHLLNSGKFVLVQREQMDQLLKEQQFQQSGCTSQECAVKVGKVLGVRKLVSGRVTKISESLWMVSAILVDVESAETVRAESIQHQGAYWQLVTEGIGTLAEKLAGIAPATAAAAVAPARPAAGGPAPQDGSAVRTVAMFPWNFRGFKTSDRPGVIRAAAAAAGPSSAARVTHSFYPDFTGGASLQSDAAVESGTWKDEVVKKSLNRTYLRAKGKELNVDAIVTAELTSGSSAPIYFTVYLYDVRTDQTLEQSDHWPSGQGLSNRKARAVVKSLLAAWNNKSQVAR
jgi:TolB-like protein